MHASLEGDGTENLGQAGPESPETLDRSVALGKMVRIECLIDRHKASIVATRYTSASIKHQS